MRLESLDFGLVVLSGVSAANTFESLHLVPSVSLDFLDTEDVGVLGGTFFLVMKRSIDGVSLHYLRYLN